MKVNKEFLIPFVGLKQGKHQFEFEIDKKFFEYFDFDEYENVNIKVDLTLDKKSTMLELSFKHKGTVNVPCDISNENFDLPVKGKLNLIVKFGEEYNDENDEMLVLPHGEYQVDVSQYIYEMIVLSVPLKRVNPESVRNSITEDKIEPAAEKPAGTDTKEETDPRWDKLKNLLTDN